MISHDLGVIAETADRVMVMYAGKAVEEASVEDLFARPLHPYTRGLLRAVPTADAELDHDTLFEIRGVVPSPFDLPPGCLFNPRCTDADAVCSRREPELREVFPGHRAACWRV